MSTDNLSKLITDIKVADPSLFPIDLTGIPLVIQNTGKMWTVQYFGIHGPNPIPLREDWEKVAELVRKDGRKIVGVLSPPAYFESIYYVREEDSPTIEEFLNGNYENKGTKGSYAIVYLAMEDK